MSDIEPEAPFSGELTIIWATEKAEILRRLKALEDDYKALWSELQHLILSIHTK